MISVEVADFVQFIRMDRPEARNALNSSAYVDLQRAFNEASADPDIRAVVISGAGGSFCAGQDLKELGDVSAETLASFPFHAFIESLANCTKPVVAAVEGDAIGAGFTMLLHVDFVIAAQTARFRLPFVALGATAEAGSSALLPAFFGPRMSARLLLTADWLLASDPEAQALVTQVVVPGTAEAQASLLAGKLASLPSHSVESIKRLLKAAHTDAVSAALARERSELVRIATAASSGHLGVAFASGVVSR